LFWHRRFILKEALIVAQFNDWRILWFRQEIIVQVQIKIPFALLSRFRLALHHMCARCQIYRLRRLDRLGCARAKEILLLFCIAPVNVISGIATHCSVPDNVVSNCRPNRLC
jgi:hypothetical protein